MDNIYQHYIIDLSSNNNFVQVPTVQGDGNNIRGFEVELIQNGIQYVVDKNDCIVSIMGTKPDTHYIMNACTVDNNGYIIVDITSQMSAVKGRGDYQIVLMSRKTNSQLKSFPFHIITTPSAFDVDYIISSDEFQLLTKETVGASIATAEANKAIQELKDNIDMFNTYVNQAKESKEVATQKATEAANSANSAKSSADRAKSEADKSATSATSSANSANTATQKANDAAASASAAKVSETNAKDSETKAKDSETKAKDSEDAAKTSETNSKTSEVNAKDSETKTKVSENNAKISEENAKVSENNSKNSEDNALASANKAKASEDKAKEHENNAAQSAVDADDSAIKAKAKANESEDYSLLSKSYAVGTGNTIRIGDDTDNSKYYSQQSKGYRNEAQVLIDNAKDTMSMIGEKLEIAEFDINDEGDLVYSLGNIYNFTVDDNGDFLWEVI